MDTVLLLTIIVVIFALAFDFINGFHDTANAIATSVSTRALKPRTAVFMAAIMNFVGALTFTGVAQTISKDIVDPFILKDGSLIILAALVAAIAWNLITWYYGIPSSSSHALIGSIAGAAISAAGFGILNYSGFLKILEALIFSPFIALFIGFLVMTIFKVVLKIVIFLKRINEFVICKLERQHFKHLRTEQMMRKKRWELLQWH